jgi:hypothetical protein
MQEGPGLSATPNSTSTQQPVTMRVLLVLVALLVGTVGGLVGGILAAANGGTTPTVLAAGAVAFGGAVSLALLVERSLGLLRE